MNTAQLKKNVVQLYGNEYLGSGFLITPTLVATAKHVIESVQESEIITLKSPCNPRLPKQKVAYQKVRKHPLKDLALLEIDSLEDYDLYLPKVYCVKPDYKTPYQSFGYPVSRKDEGYPMEGWIIDIHENSYGLNNLELFCEGLRDEFRIEGASGSPLVIHGGIFGIMVTRDDGGTLGALSFSECETFLHENNVPYEELPPLEDYEESLLKDIIKLKKIGYSDKESLPYMETLASWVPLMSMETENPVSEPEAKPLEIMINEYFPEGEFYSYNQILFTIADFGKGKSTFLKQFAANCAEKYLLTRHGEFPIYFNLRDYEDNVQQGNEEKFGCVGNYLDLNYHINFKEKKEFKKKKFIFLIDSLDENGSLSEEEITEVIKSVNQIRNLEPHLRITNKLIIASRPVPGVLKNIIERYEPHLINNRKHFASLFGFTAEQFEKYFNTLKKQFESVPAMGFNKEIIETIKEKGSLWNLMRSVLHESELRRPLLAYILYRLLSENYPLEKNNRLAIYLSFINLLTSNAKHIEEKDREYTVLEQLGNRVLLYAISVLWMTNRLEGTGGYLKTEQLERIMGKGSSLLHFLSHSYFEKKNDLFYFNHQSFAEMLLAEYYLRIFIYGALNPEADLEQIRARLSLGIPTTQTMEFFQGLLGMLVVASSDQEERKIVLKSRTSLFPIISSLGIKSFNYSKDKKDQLGTNHFYVPYIDAFYQSEALNEMNVIYEGIVEEWPIDKSHLLKMAHLAYDLMHSTDVFIYKKSHIIETPYHQVETIPEYERHFTSDMDLWIAFSVWIKLFSALDRDVNFPTLNDLPTSLLRKHSRLKDKKLTPDWIEYLTGNLKNYSEQGGGLVFQTSLVHMNLEGNYAGSKFLKLAVKDTNFKYCELPGSSFTGSTLHNVNFLSCNMKGIDFNNCILYNVSFNEVDLRGSELLDAYLINVKDMTKVKLQGTYVNIYMDTESFHRWKHIFKPYHNITVIEMKEAENRIKQFGLLL